MVEIQEPVNMGPYYLPKVEHHSNGMTVDDLIEWYIINDRDFRIKFKYKKRKKNNE